MMSKIKMVIVPCWLNLVSKELGLTGDDLANCEKLSGILSPRDFLIYKMVNFQAAEVLAKKVFDGDVALESQFVQDFEGAIDIPTLEERSACANVSIDTLIYGTTNEAMIREGQGIVALGRVNAEGVLVADEVLAKHDENYMPPEVAKSLKTQHQANGTDVNQAQFMPATPVKQ